MEKFDQELKPEWLLKPSGLSSGNAGLSNHPGTFPRADGHGKGFPSRSKLSAVDHDRSLLSNSRSASLNSSRSQNRDSSGKSGAYSSFGSFGRSSREKERGRDFELHDRDGRVHLARNSFQDPLDLVPSVLDGDKLRRSHSMISERASDTWHKGLGISLNNSAVSRSAVNGVSFDKDFPSLGTEERSVSTGGGRVASPPGVSPSIQSICKATASIGGIENWNSKLVEIPVTAGSNETGSEASSQEATICKSPATLTSTTGLNMAETVAQAPSRARTPPQSSIDIQKIEEQTLRQARQLIPLTPTMSKSSASNSSDKLKNKGGRVESGTITKTGHQLSLQPVSPVRAPARSDSRKTTQLGTFQVLNREKNGTAATVKDAANNSNVINPVGLAPSGLSCPMKNSTNQKAKTDVKSGVVSASQGLFGENKLHLQAKDKHEFFNQLRNKTSSSSVVNHEAGAPSSAVRDSEELSAFGDCHGKADALFKSEPKPADDNSPDASCDSVDPILLDEEADPCAGPVDPEEEAFLRSLGWDQNAVVSLLTEEEIQDFNAKLAQYQKEKGDKPGPKLP